MARRTSLCLKSCSLSILCVYLNEPAKIILLLVSDRLIVLDIFILNILLFGKLLFTIEIKGQRDCYGAISGTRDRLW